MSWQTPEGLARARLQRRAGLEAFFDAPDGQTTPSTDHCTHIQAAPRNPGQACSFLGLDSGSNVPRTGLRSSFTMYRGDFHSELCSDGEAMRIDPEGQPYLVDTEARHDVQLEFALLCALTIFVGTALVGIVFGMQQAKARGEAGQAEASSSEAAAKPKAKPKAKSGAEAKAKPKAKAAS